MKIIQTHQFIVQDLFRLLDHLNEEEYVQNLSILNTSISAHVRHIIEFYQCFFEQWEGDLINYDKRARNKEIETSKEKTIAALDLLLSNLEKNFIDKGLKIEMNQSLDDHDSKKVLSSLERELYFLADHSVHHLAMIKIALRFMGRDAELFQNLGVSPATQRFILSSNPFNQ